MIASDWFNYHPSSVVLQDASDSRLGLEQIDADLLQIGGQRFGLN
jgi:hypothetical protein